MRSNQATGRAMKAALWFALAGCNHSPVTADASAMVADACCTDSDAREPDPADAAGPDADLHTCQPQAHIDPVPLTGAQVFKLIQSRGGVAGSLPCAAVPGGDSAAIAFQLTAAADLAWTYQQVGDHVAGVFATTDASLACDAGTLLSCIPNMGANQNGQFTLANVPAGAYYIVFAGNLPDAPPTFYSGTVAAQVSATPHT